MVRFFPCFECIASLEQFTARIPFDGMPCRSSRHRHSFIANSITADTWNKSTAFEILISFMCRGARNGVSVCVCVVWHSYITTPASTLGRVLLLMWISHAIARGFSCALYVQVFGCVTTSNTHSAREIFAHLTAIHRTRCAVFPPELIVCVFYSLLPSCWLLLLLPVVALQNECVLSVWHNKQFRRVQPESPNNFGRKTDGQHRQSTPFIQPSRRRFVAAVGNQYSI